MLDLTNCTFIIPVRIDSSDRMFNFMYTVGYLCRNFKTNIFIFECDKEQRALSLLNNIPKYETKINYRFEKSEDSIFHRTRLLNEMLWEVKTPITCNYDCDVFFKPATYIKACEAVLNEGYDLVYPYFFGESQYMVNRPKLTDDLTEEIKHVKNQSQYGHAQFFNTESYKAGGGENEYFVGWGPEDQERAYRFKTLGYKVKWLDDCYIWHIEHSRGINSGRNNPHFENLEKVFEYIKSLTPEALREYYTNPPYLKKYKKKMITLLTYADKNYLRQQEKLVEKALQLDTVDYYITMNREDLTKTDFYEQNKDILDKPRGAGFWVWKPYLIMEALKTMESDDILVYLDSGDLITRNFRVFVQRAMRNNELLLTTGGYTNSAYTKMDCFVIMDCNNEKYHSATQMEAGVIVLKNTHKTMEILQEWLKWCLTPGVVMDEPNNYKNLPDFVEHRWDQSILSLLQVKYNLPHSNEMRTYINCNQND